MNIIVKRWLRSLISKEITINLAHHHGRHDRLFPLFWIYDEAHNMLSVYEGAKSLMS